MRATSRSLRRARALLPALLPALLGASITACAALSPTVRATPGDEIPTGFPRQCAADEVQVMLLGTYHFSGSSGDAVKQSPDDMLAAPRQEELQELVASLAAWAPQQVAVEWPFTFTDSTTARYRRFQAEGSSLNRNEVVQLGFRLAARLNHANVYPIDERHSAPSDSITALFRRRPDLERPLEDAISQLQREADSVTAWRRNTTLIEHLREMNTERALSGGNSFAMFGGYLGAGEGTNRGGAEVLGGWYTRNVLMAHNLTRVVQPGTKRILLLVGAGHVPPLRNILHESPRFCPVSPLPFLR